MPDAHVDHAADDLIQTAVAGLLRRVPERWEEYDADSLTATESKALFLLVAAGMVERRIRLRVRPHNHPVAVEATVTATGEYGFAQALEPLLASMWTDWKDAFLAWRNGEMQGEPATITEHLKPDEWRLTDQGLLARADLNGGNAQVALGFVLRRGFFALPQLILEPGRERVSPGGGDPGHGRLVTMRKVPAETASPTAVTVTNWEEAAAGFTTAYQKLMSNGGPARTDGDGRANGEGGYQDRAAKPTTRTSAPPFWEQRVADYLAAHQKHLDKMQDAYLANERVLGDGIYGQFFTPTIIARAITDNDNDRGAVGRTSAYKASAQKYRNGERWSDANI